MDEILAIVQQTLLNLKNKGIKPLPLEYEKEFCSVAKNQNIKHLSHNRIVILSQFIIELLSYFKNTPLKNSIEILVKNIERSPELILKPAIQDEIKKVFFNHIKNNQKIIQQQTTDISKLVEHANVYLEKAITSNESGSSEIKEIKNEILSINITNDSSNIFSPIQEKLIKTTTKIEDEIKKVTNNLNLSQKDIQELEKKIHDLEKELNQVKEESSLDHLTKVFTRKSYEEHTKVFDSNFIRHQEKFAIIFIDIDHFKLINDTYGHDAGDVVLSTFAKILQSQTRKNDIIARFGGEEFICLIKYDVLDQVSNYIQRVNKIISQNDFIYQNRKIKVRFSAGITLRDKYLSYDNALKKADDLLYKAKNNGRNQIWLEDKQLS